MGHNSVVSSHPKSIEVPRVDGLLTGSSDLGRHNLVSKLRFTITQGLMGIVLILACHNLVSELRLTIT